MRKVKQPTPVKSASPRGGAKGAPAPNIRVPAKAAAPSRGARRKASGVAKATKKAAPKGARQVKQVKGRAASKGAAASVTPALTIRELDPFRICGDRTSVTQLFRVDETIVPTGKAASSRQVHLVFNDRHGWYCEHGRGCHAVSAVMRHAGIR